MSEKIFFKKGTEYISGLIEESLLAGLRAAAVLGNWEIESEIRIPSDFTLVLDGCHLKMADGVYSNMFVNRLCGTAEGKRSSNFDRNIAIIGKNGAIIDGGNYNGLSERSHSQNGLPPIWKNNLILMANVEGFEISGLACKNQRWWALNFLFCRNGHIHDMDFEASDLSCDSEGNITHGVSIQRYDDIVVKNADGIDLRQGCRNIVIENITGFTEDDTVALTGLKGELEKEFFVEGLETDICNVSIKNVAASALCSIVRLLNQGGIKLHDILIDGVTDTSAASVHMSRGEFGVRIGDNHMYGERHSLPGETYGITVKNVRSRGARAALALAGTVENLCMENIEAFDSAVAMVDNRLG